ncbi:MAG TPA: FadR/GntR family transcriptional regulator [Planctomycetota bacterium]|jgi:GntR family transcriptional repressor for pyruvate dehydrogenase complex|nr:FadR/GntR family transcriptional regulator [Planctomycetota bacterium]
MKPTLAGTSPFMNNVMDRVRKRLAPGHSLPSERDLATQLRVSRPSVREALRTLSLMGVVHTRRGAGTCVSDSGSDVLRAPLQFIMMLDRPSIAHLHETRQLLEVFLAGQAASRRTLKDLGAMSTALEEMRERLSRPRDVTDPDIRFHQAVAAAAHNPILERFVNSLQENVRAMINAAWPGNRSMRFSQKSHESIYDAIERKDVKAARRAMTEHMDVTAQELRRVKLLK